MDTPFVFGVIAPVSFVKELYTVVKGRTINKRPVEIREIDEDDDLSGIHAIFLAGSQIGSVAQLRRKADGLPLLVITESASGLEYGATINFTEKNNRISFEVALDVAQQKGLRLSAEMLKVAGNVRQ